MRTHVEFRSDKFPAYPGEGEKINPDLWGQCLAEYLLANLKKHDVSTDKDIGFEDWGCKLTLIGTPFSMWIGCGHYQEYPNGYLCFIEPSRPVIRKFLFKKIDTTVEVARIADTLDKILTSDPDIHDLRWWLEDGK